LDIFKNIKRALTLEKRPLYHDGVRIVGSIAFQEEKTSSKTTMTGGPSVYSEVLMDEDEVDDIMDLPTISNAYWDPHSGEIKFDKQLSKVLVDHTMSFEDAISMNERRRAERMYELEDKGFYTERVVERIIATMRASLEEGSRIDGGSTIDDEQASIDIDSLVGSQVLSVDSPHAPIIQAIPPIRSDLRLVRKPLGGNHVFSHSTKQHLSIPKAFGFDKIAMKKKQLELEEDTDDEEFEEAVMNVVESLED